MKYLLYMMGQVAYHNSLLTGHSRRNAAIRMGPHAQPSVPITGHKQDQWCGIYIFLSSGTIGVLFVNERMSMHSTLSERGCCRTDGRFA